MGTKTTHEAMWLGEWNWPCLATCNSKRKPLSSGYGATFKESAVPQLLDRSSETSPWRGPWSRFCRVLEDREEGVLGKGECRSIGRGVVWVGVETLRGRGLERCLLCRSLELAAGQAAM